MSHTNIDFFEILRILGEHDVKFIVVGGVSALLNGAPVMTFDLDIVHERSPQNINLLLGALKQLQAHYRYHPNKIEPNESHLESTGHQLLNTLHGPLDILGQIDDQKDYNQLLPYSHEVELLKNTFHVLDLDMLIEVKKRANRDKDRAVLPVLEVTLKEQKDS